MRYSPRALISVLLLLGSSVALASDVRGPAPPNALIEAKGPDDNLGIAGQTRGDLHRVVSDVNGADKKIHRLQISNGATGDAGITAGNYTEILFTPLKDGKSSPVDILSDRGYLATSIVWARIWVSGVNGSDIDIFHGYLE